ncbi:MAG: DedA family protein [Chlorobiaceae bacterium]|nr:DedA family protein [Chlorobiaceae bacterium]NTV60799.1 DedA family protein [Chlorobiaceae bacterium]
MDHSLSGLTSFIADFIVHIDTHLVSLMAQYGSWIYGILFLIVFCETGLVVTPFLPGDSLLFAAGTLASLQGSSLDPHILVLVFCSAAFIGDNLNFFIGRSIGPKVFHFQKSRFFNPEHLAMTHAFYEKYGGVTVVLARFVPIVRTFSPFVAGIGTMPYRKFLFFSVGGALLWVSLFCYSGYYFGHFPFVQENRKLIFLGIIAVSLLPPVAGYLGHFFRKRDAA